ncbi:nucleotidyltransferase domain-containing protein [Paenibacillus peoriae]|uniref:nucleotidyltransferase domain-containing protein n=1 Tax=Paenibacillus peoriae TaxID=59893 RepID=UPI00096D5C37|nr:nucleotidyltransferase domain-containing protein [Paenibacillus peoriae]OMF43533.1 hypothetical protein BK135_17935 [Paenibacillus peoriae]
MSIEESIIRQLSSHTYFNCEKLFIRGSYAFNLQNQYSDFDILVVSDDFIDLDIVTRKRILLKSLGENVEIKVDAICLSQKEYSYIFKISTDDSLNELKEVSL